MILAAAAPASNIMPTVMATAIIAWSVYRRVRRNIGRQPFQPKRMIARIAIFSILSVMFAVIGLLIHPPVLYGLCGGLVLGGLVALFGLHLTRCEACADGRYYTPNAYIGVAFSMLLVARLVYRFFILSKISGTASNPGPSLMQSPLTMFTFGLVAGYYIVYYIGIFARCQALAANSIE